MKDKKLKCGALSLGIADRFRTLSFVRRLPLYIILSAFAILYLEPVLYMLSMSFKSIADVTDSTAKWIPRNPTMTNVKFAFDSMSIAPKFSPDRN